jgi:hypothetical protein
VERHGVVNGAVAFKDVAAQCLVRNFEFQKFSFDLKLYFADLDGYFGWSPPKIEL